MRSAFQLAEAADDLKKRRKKEKNKGFLE